MNQRLQGHEAAAAYSASYSQSAGSMAIDNNADPVEAYFECISTCSLDDGECVTVCTEILRDRS